MAEGSNGRSVQPGDNRTNWIQEYIGRHITPESTFGLFTSAFDTCAPTDDEQVLTIEIRLLSVVTARPLFEELRCEQDVAGGETKTVKSKFRLIVEVICPGDNIPASMLRSGICEVWDLDQRCETEADVRKASTYMPPLSENILVNPPMTFRCKVSKPPASIRIWMGFCRRDVSNEAPIRAHIAWEMEGWNEVDITKWSRWRNQSAFLNIQPEQDSSYTTEGKEWEDGGIARVEVLGRIEKKPETNPLLRSEKLRLRANVIDGNIDGRILDVTPMLNNINRYDARNSTPWNFLRNLRSDLNWGRGWCPVEFSPFRVPKALTVEFGRELIAWVDNNALELEQNAMDVDKFIEVPYKPVSKGRAGSSRKSKTKYPGVTVVDLKLYDDENVVRKLSTIILEKMETVDALTHSKGLEAKEYLGLTSPTSLYLIKCKNNSPGKTIEHFTFEAKLCTGLVCLRHSDYCPEGNDLYIRDKNGIVSHSAQDLHPIDLMFIDPVHKYGLKNTANKNEQFLIVCNN